jgi:hypothetical protein
MSPVASIKGLYKRVGEISRNDGGETPFGRLQITQKGI